MPQSANCAEDRQDSSAQFFGEVWSCATTGAGDGPDSAENRGVPQLQFLIVANIPVITTFEFP